MSKKRSHEEDKAIQAAAAELNGSAAGSSTKKQKTRGNAAPAASPVKKGRPSKARAKKAGKDPHTPDQAEAQSVESAGTIPTVGEDEEVEGGEEDEVPTDVETDEKPEGDLEDEKEGREQKAPKARKPTAQGEGRKSQPATSAFSPPAPKVPAGTNSTKAAAAVLNNSATPAFVAPTIENMAKFAPVSILGTPAAPSSKGSESPVTDKYRKYRLKQKERFVDLQRELEEAKQEVERHREKERKLLYLLLISHKQVTIRDDELARLNLELLKYKNSAAARDPARPVEEAEAPEIAQGLISLREGNHVSAAHTTTTTTTTTITASSLSSNAASNPAPSPFMPNRKHPSTMLAMRMPSLTNDFPPPNPTSSQNSNSIPLQSAPQSQGSKSFDFGFPSLGDVPNFGDELLERVIPEGKEDEMENAFINSLIDDDIAQERYRQRLNRFRSSSMVAQHVGQILSQPAETLSIPSLARGTSDLQLLQRSSSMSQPTASGAPTTTTTTRMGSVDQLITADLMLNRDETRKSPSKEEKLKAGYYSQVFKKA